MKTAIQEMILKLPNEFIFDNPIIILEALKKEKEQIIEAGNACISEKRKSHELISKMSDDELLSEMKKGFTTYGEEYYEQTYNQKK
jgi:hypothetical protein